MKYTEMEEETAWRRLVEAIREADDACASPRLFHRARGGDEESQERFCVGEGTAVALYEEADYEDESDNNGSQTARSISGPDHSEAISFETYDRHRREWEEKRTQLEMGLMMYRYKYEEMERQLKLLPAPVEIVSKEMGEQAARLRALEEEQSKKEEAINKAHEIVREARTACQHYKSSIAELQAKLREEEQVKASLRREWEHAMAQANRPWWKRFLGIG